MIPREQCSVTLWLATGGSRSTNTPPVTLRSLQSVETSSTVNNAARSFNGCLPNGTRRVSSRQRVHRPPAVAASANSHCSLDSGPFLGEVCREAAESAGISTPMAGSNRVRAGGLSNRRELTLRPIAGGLSTAGASRNIETTRSVGPTLSPTTVDRWLVLRAPAWDHWTLSTVRRCPACGGQPHRRHKRYSARQS